MSHPEHGRFGAYGGQYVPETLMPALAEVFPGAGFQRCRERRLAVLPSALRSLFSAW